MLDLSVSDAIVFALIVAAHGTAAALGALSLLAPHRRCGAWLGPCVLVAAVLDVALLGLRGVSIRAVPLTGLFESLVVLALVFGILYLLLRSAVQQVWFGAIMAGSMLSMVLVAAFVARPAARPLELAATPWAVAHATAMILASASVVFAAANAGLYLLGSYRLKHKGIMQVLGRIPNMETLVHMNGLGVRVGFVLLTVGVISGLGMAAWAGPGMVRWLADGKVVCIILAWGVLGAVLVLERFGRLRAKGRAYVTMAVFGLILAATIGVTVAGATRHKFSAERPPAAGAAAQLVSVAWGVLRGTKRVLQPPNSPRPGGVCGGAARHVRRLTADETSLATVPRAESLSAAAYRAGEKSVKGEKGPEERPAGIPSHLSYPSHPSPPSDVADVSLP
jgi:ABC-type uncharacterized transport system permease subunit